MTQELPKYNVDIIADWFLAKESMSQSKLQKLVYYTQSWAMVVLDQPIIDTEFEAWVHGPVSRKLHFRFNDNADQFAPLPDIAILRELEIALSFMSTPTIKDPAVEQLLASVWATYGAQDKFELEALTHRELPWQNARLGLTDHEPSNNIISVIDMKNFYSTIYIGNLI